MVKCDLPITTMTILVGPPRMSLAFILHYTVDTLNVQDKGLKGQGKKVVTLFFSLFFWCFDIFWFFDFDTYTLARDHNPILEFKYTHAFLWKYWVKHS